MRIGILTGGGDVPGLNPCIRSITLNADDLGWDVIGESTYGIAGPRGMVGGQALDYTATVGHKTAHALGTYSRGFLGLDDSCAQREISHLSLREAARLGHRELGFRVTDICQL